MHILVYGGTFDPVHNGHLLPARAARQAIVADRLLLIPAYLSPHKLSQSTAAPEHRLRMLELATAGDPHIAIDNRELLRQGPSYTFDTLGDLQREQPANQFTLLLGADQLPKLHTWHRIAEILERTPIALMPRPGQSTEVGLQAVAQTLGTPTAEKLRHALLTTPLVDISATTIRDRIREGLPVADLVPPAVADYIAAHHLYR